MTTPFWHLVATNRLLNRLIVHRLLKVFRPIHTENILRIRYAEDRLQEAVGPEELTAELARTGFSKLDRRYLQGRGDMPPPAANFAFALFGRD